jgi:hypothetical protein
MFWLALALLNAFSRRGAIAPLLISITKIFVSQKNIVFT